MTIHVCSLAALDEAIARHSPTHLITLLDPESLIPTPKTMSPDRHLRVGVNDITTPQIGLTHPDAAHVEEILGFVEAWGVGGDLVVHCWAGVSRSTATAFIAACAHSKAGEEEQHAWEIRKTAAYAQPNALLVEIADALLGRQGRMIRALQAIGPGDFESYPELPLFTLPLAAPA